MGKSGCDTSHTFDNWSRGYGVIAHSPETCARIRRLVVDLSASGARSESDCYAALSAADRLASATMWLVVHMTYAKQVDISGAPLPAAAFKDAPEGHTGGALNVALAYVGYLTANVLSATTRGWILGQGHCVAAIEAANALVDNLSPSQVGRYGPTESGLSQMCADFYDYEIDAMGLPRAPLGSHVNAHTAGGVSEGGYLGFAEVQYMHMPLPGESLVAILSDGAFEEQRGSDWAERWWRAEDCGLVAPVMILNGRRIEQRTEIAQDGGVAWLSRHLDVNGFDPIAIDGCDPAAYAWAVIESERRLVAAANAIREGRSTYPVKLPFAIAHTQKGFGFPGAGTNRAHNLPLEGSPRREEAVRAVFNDAARRLFVSEPELEAARKVFASHERQERVKERDNAIATRNPEAPVLPPAPPIALGKPVSSMASLDEWMVEFVRANPKARFRVGNPDELTSNQMSGLLELLKHRVNRPEPQSPEAIDGAVITALNEEAVIGAALGNKGGINLAVTYEAFAVKMLGAARQDIIFARQQVEVGRPPQWIGVPIVATSHTWENGKNQQSHQDPTFCEALLGEMSDVSRVFFPCDAATTVECVRQVYATRGIIACIVAAKRATPAILDAAAAAVAVNTGAFHVESESNPQIQIIAIGAYQLVQAQRAAARLRERGWRALTTCILEPGRMRSPRDHFEKEVTLSDAELKRLFPPGLRKVLVTHTRPEVIVGTLRRVDEGPSSLRAHGYINRGGTLDAFGMLFANRCTWAHLLDSVAQLIDAPTSALLDPGEIAAVHGRGNPTALS